MLVSGAGMFLGGIVFAVLIGFWNIPVQHDLPTLGAVSVMVIFGTVIAYTAYLQGVDDVGPVVTSILGSVEPLSATSTDASCTVSPRKTAVLSALSVNVYFGGSVTSSVSSVVVSPLGSSRIPGVFSSSQEARTAKEETSIARIMKRDTSCFMCLFMIVLPSFL
jgi:hypothetical protein